MLKASLYLEEAVSVSPQHHQWDDKKGFKCSPAHLPHLPGELVGNLLEQVRSVQPSLSWLSATDCQSLGR